MAHDSSVGSHNPTTRHGAGSIRTLRLRKEAVDGRFLLYHYSPKSIYHEVLDLSAHGTPTSRNRLKEERCSHRSVKPSNLTKIFGRLSLEPDSQGGFSNDRL
jgi:hypothetical protein